MTIIRETVPQNLAKRVIVARGSDFLPTIFPHRLAGVTVRVPPLPRE